MRKIVFAFLVFLTFFFVASETKASLLTINGEGEVIVKVLSSEDSIALGYPETSELEVKQVANSGSEENSQVTLTKKDGIISLQVGSEKSLDVTNWKDDLVEIEERPNTKRIKVGLMGDDFTIAQEGIVASTGFPVNIDPYENQLSLTTQTGKKYLKVLPFDAAQSVLRTRLVNNITSKPFTIVEEEKGLSYVIDGNKVINIVGVYDFEIPITARVSALTGEVIAIDEPSWLKPLSFLFV
ncbi:hypothetical protein ACFL0F_01580 [Patescibacteria group bacterium]